MARSPSRPAEAPGDRAVASATRGSSAHRVAIGETPPPGPASANPFRLLCESCGYPLDPRWLDESAVPADPGADGVGPGCPECGEPVAASLPWARDGVAWQRAWSPGSYLRTAAGLVWRPRRSFRRMRLEGPPTAGRMFLVVNLCLVAAVAGGFARWGHGQGWLPAWLYGMAAAKFALLLTYVEVLGVAFFSRRRGWRVPLAVAERVAGFASLGWVATAVLLGGASLGLMSVVDLTYGRLWDHRTPEAVGLLGGLVFFAVTALSFELLVWTGVRQVRFGNRRPPPNDSRSGRRGRLVDPAGVTAGQRAKSPAAAVAAADHEG